MSRAMSSVADGRAASSAFDDSRSRRFKSENHFAMVSPIFAGFLTNAPKPFSTTNFTLPASCPGKWEDNKQGKPRVAASAIVPGPALVTMQSLAAIHSSMLSTKPRIVGFTLSGHCLSSSSFFTCAFLPQTTTSPDGSFASPRASPRAVATLAMPPTPSPPPTTNAVGTPVVSPNLLRVASLIFSEPARSQKPSRSGRPRLMILSSGTPHLEAIFSKASEGTNV
mmetsp:Transcript_25519/g.71777  ORF Transcript_25519/g.71777 Transcript_25519/m.71777 type:complete len:224 (+) Transcript_25519:64-735(+)